MTRGTPVIRGGTQLAPNGTLSFPRNGRDYQVEVSLVEYNPGKPDLDQLREVREALEARLPDGTEVVDYTGATPRRFFIGDPGRK